MNWLDQHLAFLDDVDASAWTSRIRAFEVVLVLVSAGECWSIAFQTWPATQTFRIIGLVLSTLCGLVALSSRFRRQGFVALALTIAFTAWNSFPLTPNHGYLEIFLCGLCALLDPTEQEEQRLLIRGIRWVTCVIMFFAGIQKLVHGYYTSGLMPAFLLMEPRFRAIFGLFLPRDELQRILSYSGMDGSGPYLVAPPLFLLVSNLVWILEITMAVALLVPRLRTLTVFAGIAFVLAIEVAAREVFFGMLFVSLSLMFLTTDANRRFVPIVAVACVVIILVRIGILPAMELH